MPVIRRGGPEDLPEVAAIQAASPGAAAWNPADYLQHEFRVAVSGNRVSGFVVCRTLAQDEREVLNLAVAPESRCQGVGRALLASVLSGYRGAVHLEVRESNEVALKFYKSMGFQEVGVRQKYYDFPPEAAIVMKFHSC